MEVPFSSLNNTEFSRLPNGKSIIPKKELKATPTIFENLNTFTKNENMACKYYSNQQFKKFKKDVMVLFGVQKVRRIIKKDYKQDIRIPSIRI